MKRIIIAIIFATSLIANCYWQIPLTSNQIKEKSPYTYNLEEIFYADVNFGKGKSSLVKTVFDITSSKNYIVSSACSDASCPTQSSKYECKEGCTVPESGATHTLKFFGGRQDVSEAITGNSKVTIKQNNFEAWPIEFPKKFNEGSETQVLKDVSAGIGLNSNADDSFFGKIKDKVKIENNGFSFVFLDKVKSLYLGAPQLFFAAGGKQEAFTNEGSVTGKGELNWKLKLKDLQYKKLASSDFTAIGGFAGQLAAFDSTTKWNWISDAQLTNLVAIINSNKEICKKNVTAPSRNVYFCQCNKDLFPTLYFQFEGSVDKKSNTKFALHYADYVEELDKKNDRCLLLFRGQDDFKDVPAAAGGAGAGGAGGAEGGAGGAGGASLLIQHDAKVPDVSSQIYLGTTFLRAIYTYFDADKNRILLSQSAQVNLGPTHLNKSPRYLFIFLGAALAILSIAILLSILKKCPYDPSVHKNVQQVQKDVLPQQQLVQQQQQQPLIVQQSQAPIVLRQSIPAQYIYKPQGFPGNVIINSSQQFKPQ